MIDSLRSSPAHTSWDELRLLCVERFDSAAVQRLEGLLRIVEKGTEEDQQSSLQAGFDVAALVVGMRLDAQSVAAALLCPLLLSQEEAGQERLLEACAEKLGGDGRVLLDAVRRIAQVRWSRLEEQAAETLRKTLVAIAKDVRAIVLLLSHRVVQLRTSPGEDLSPGDAGVLAEETLQIFSPLANRLGIWQLKWELEDRSFLLRQPDIYAELYRHLAEGRERRQAYIDEVLIALRLQMDREGLSGEVKGRPKHLYSIYKKMQRKQISFEQVYDISAVRVLTDTVAGCYAILGAVHSLWTPIPTEFDDYIAMPKGNGYQSLHTAVIGPRGRPVEVQVRTRDMHQFAEFGVAAHWAYKEQRRSGGLGADRFLLLRQLTDWEKDVAEATDLAESLKTDLFEDQVFVFTPGGDIIDLPKGATPLDFAYRVHTQVGHRCKGVRVNDQMVPLTTSLQTGDRVEILTQRHSNPSRDWMSRGAGFLKTASARAKVRHWFKQQGREEAVAAGKEMLQRELERLERPPALDALCEALKAKSLEELYASLGFGERRSVAVYNAAIQLSQPVPELAPDQPVESVGDRAPPSGVSISGADPVMGSRARCCKPLPGDDVVGFVTRGRGLTIHRRDCTALLHTGEPERILDVDWGAPKRQRFTAEVEVLTLEGPAILGELIERLGGQGAHVAAANSQTPRGGRAVIRLSLELRDARHLNQVLEQLPRMPQVLEVRRLGS